MDALKSKGQMLDQINLEQIPRSGFDLSYNNKGTGKIGRIIPIRCMETLPGDSIKGSTQIAMQFEPLAVPILANMRLKSETWYCPNHILWDGWDKFITKGEDLSDTSKVPSFTLRNALDVICSLLRTNSRDLSFGLQNKKQVIDEAPFPLDPEKETCVNNVFIDCDSLISAVEGFKTLYKYGNQTHSDYDDLFDYLIPVCDNFISTLNELKVTCSVLRHSYLDGSSVSQIPVRSFYIFDMATQNVKDIINNLYGACLLGDLYSMDMPGITLTEYESKTHGFLGRNLAERGLPIENFKFSEFGIAFCNFLYDAISPLLGLGSNLDYLGYRCLTPTDFFVNYALSCYLCLDDGYDLTSSIQSFDVGFVSFISSDYIKESPMSVLPLRAMYAIWWNNYRDQLLETSSPEPCTLSTISNEELKQLLIPRLRCWSKDTFTTALANTGTGNMVVPISNSLSGYRTSYDFANDTKEDILDMDKTSFKLSDGTQIDLPTRFIDSMHNKKSGGTYLKYGFSLDTLRRAGRTEKWIQKALIYGNRIQDALFTHWGVKIKNERIQLPEFVSSSVQLVKIDTILNNTTTSESIAGDKAGFASAYDQGNGFDFYSPENGILLSFMTVLPEQSYSGGLPRFMSKLSIFDFAFPEFAQIGMDAVYLSEIAQSPIVDVSDNDVFGYQGRYYDYKCKQDEEHGELCSTQDMYTFARTYNMYDPNSRPKLNYRFVHCHPALDMFVVDDPSQDQFRYDIHHSVACSRALPVCGMSV